MVRNKTCRKDLSQNKYTQSAKKIKRIVQFSSDLKEICIDFSLAGLFGFCQFDIDIDIDINCKCV